MPRVSLRFPLWRGGKQGGRGDGPWAGPEVAQRAGHCYHTLHSPVLPPAAGCRCMDEPPPQDVWLRIPSALPALSPRHAWPMSGAGGACSPSPDSKFGVPRTQRGITKAPTDRAFARNQTLFSVLCLRGWSGPLNSPLRKHTFPLHGFGN